MTNYNAKGKLERLQKLLEETNCKESAQIMEIIESIVHHAIYSDGNSKSEINTLYENAFFSKCPEKELQFEAYRLNIQDVKSKVLLVEHPPLQQSDLMEEVLASIVESRSGQNYLIPSGNNYFAVIYEIASEDDSKEFALAMADSIMDELGLKVTVGIGSVYYEILTVCRSFQDAELALNAGRLLLGDGTVYEYDKLGIAKIVYEMEETQCRKFYQEALTEEAVKELESKEMLESIQTFFKCNLNISVAARELYVHRNTLVYRIEKFNKASGYDLSNFEDAVVVRMALMIRRMLDDTV